MNALAYRSVNPTTGELLDEYPFITVEDLADALDAADEAFVSWSARPIEERAHVARRISEVLRERGGELAATVTREMGKLAPEVADEAELAADIFAYYAEHGPEFAAEQVLSDTERERTVLQHLPVGPLLGIMPWNYPLYQVARFVAPNLVLGNTILLKHAESTPAATGGASSIPPPRAHTVSSGCRSLCMMMRPRHAEIEESVHAIASTSSRAKTACTGRGFAAVEPGTSVPMMTSRKMSTVKRIGSQEWTCWMNFGCVSGG